MTNLDFIKTIEKNYTKNIEKATIRNIESFAILDKNILFGISVSNTPSVDKTEDYFYDSVKRTHVYKLNSIKDLKELLVKMNAFENKTDDILYRILSKNHVNPDNPFYLNIYLFEGIGI